MQGRSAPLLAGRKFRLDQGGVRVHVLAQRISVTYTAYRVHQPIEDRGGARPFWLKGETRAAKHSVFAWSRSVSSASRTGSYKILRKSATGQPDAARNNGNRAAESISSKSARVEEH